MVYQGKELEPITEPQVFDPPKRMLVWDECSNIPQVRDVVAIVPKCNVQRRVMTYGGVGWSYCAEFEENPDYKPRRATNLEFSVRKRSCTNMGVKESQCKRIATYLKGGGILTPMDALNMFGCFRLSARIADLRNGGMKIVTKYVTNNGKTFAQYRMG